MPSTPSGQPEVKVFNEGDVVFPLSFAQRRLWFLHQLDPGNTFYNLPLAVPFKIDVNTAVLQRSVNAIIARHETLRTVFTTLDDEPVQVIRPTMPVQLAVIDLRTLSTEEQTAETTRLTTEIAQQPFDLASGPLLRVALLRRGPQDYVLVLVFHHIISDGWSMGVFWRELIAAYNAVYSGHPSPLEELSIQYADFSVWQRDRLRGEHLAELMAYWRKHLDGLPTLQLPTDRPRPPVLSYRGAFKELMLPRSMTNALKSLSQSQGVTLFMTLFAAFALVLHRYSGQDDIVVGLPSAGRDHKELEGLIGFFVNSLVLRVDLSGDPDVGTLLARVRETALDAYAHQELPFEKLVEELQPTRDLSRNPLFQVTFQLFSAIDKGGREPAADESPAMTITRGAAIFDLAVNLWEVNGEIGGQVEYSTDLFDDATVSRFIGHYRTLLKSILAGPSTRLSQLQMLTSAELRQMLHEWNATDGVVPPHCVHQLVAQQAAQHPDALAVSDGNATLSYGELNRRANRVARRLLALGIKRDSLVGVCTERDVSMVVAMLATLKAGGAYVPLDPNYPPDRLAFMIADSAAAVVLTERAVSRLPPRQGTVLLLLDEEMPDVEDDIDVDGRAGTDDLCYVVYTSGSTGQPKGVAVRHGGLMNLVAWHRSKFSVTAADRASQVASLGFDACGWEVWPYLAAGASVHIIADDLRASPHDLINALIEREITIAFLPTPLAQAVFDDPAHVLLKLRYLLTGGDKLARLPPSGNDFVTVNNYGPTEYSVVATSCVLQADQGTPPIGRPIANTQIYVLDRDLNPVPVGVTGELYIGGDGLARGYHNRSDLTAEHFIDNPFPGTACARLYRTGDLVRYRPDGMLDYLGRTDSQIKMRGFRIELGEIEAVLAADADVSDAVAAMLPRDHDSGRLVAYVVPKRTQLNGANGAGRAARREFAARLRRRLRSQLPDYMVPAEFVVLAQLPQTPNGKVDRRALPASDLGHADDGATSGAPTSDLEEVLVGMWAEVLDIDRAGVDDNFFEVGGHSLLAARLISRVRDRLKVDVPLQMLFRAPTPAQFAAALLASADNPLAVEKAAKVVASLSRLSDDEVKRLLAQSTAPAEAEAAFAGRKVRS